MLEEQCIALECIMLVKEECLKIESRIVLLVHLLFPSLWSMHLERDNTIRESHTVWIEICGKWIAHQVMAKILYIIQMMEITADWLYNFYLYATKIKSRLPKQFSFNGGKCYLYTSFFSKLKISSLTLHSVSKYFLSLFLYFLYTAHSC